ncbi:hypothetical protein AXF42_Ash014711 [Apostasia shenzhenica]|uniref:Uncharacterized protein n=1 Tax=Apostasia shenzhenica TaxID=1088818 RepID=A0A2H9ZW25_9ASPA|nr:hypothetical protein AXF42_Ash014711 [Apostasia shenzhenica]
MATRKVVLRLPVEDAKKRSKALKIAVGFPGVVSATSWGDKIMIVGEGLDSVALVMALRKKFGFVELVSVANLNEDFESFADTEMNEFTQKMRHTVPSYPTITTTTHPYINPPQPYIYEVHHPTSYDSCNIM